MSIKNFSVNAEVTLGNEVTGSSPVGSLDEGKTFIDRDISNPSTESSNEDGILIAESKGRPRALSYTFNNNQDFCSYGKLKAELLEFKNALLMPSDVPKHDRPVERMIRFAMYEWEYQQVNGYAESFWKQALGNGIGYSEEVYFELGCCFYPLPSSFNELGVGKLPIDFLKSQHENLMEVKKSFPLLNYFEMVHVKGDENWYIFAEYEDQGESFPGLIVITPDNIVQLYLIEPSRFFQLCCSIMEKTSLLTVILRDLK